MFCVLRVRVRGGLSACDGGVGASVVGDTPCVPRVLGRGWHWGGGGGRAAAPHAALSCHAVLYTGFMAVTHSQLAFWERLYQPQSREQGLSQGGGWGWVPLVHVPAPHGEDEGLSPTGHPDPRLCSAPQPGLTSSPLFSLCPCLGLGLWEQPSVPQQRPWGKWWQNLPCRTAWGGHRARGSLCLWGWK